MGFLPEHRYRASLPWPNEGDELETGPIGNLGNVRETTALEVVVEAVEVLRGSRVRSEGRAVYRHEIPVEFGAWQRHFDGELLGRRHAWSRHECHAKHLDIQAGDGLVIAELPFAGRRRYDRATFRPAVRKDRVPYFAPSFVHKLREAKTQRRGDIVTLALRLLEDENIVGLDPFNTGAKRVAGISIPSPPFGEAPKGHSRPGGKGEEGRTGWALGMCRAPDKVYRAVLLGLFERIQAEAEKQARSDGLMSVSDGRLRFAYPPSRGAKAERLRLTDDVPDHADVLACHAAWLAMAGPGPHEKMPEDRSVAEVAFRRLNDLLYNLQRRVDRSKRIGGAHAGAV
jgi:hypothetical protein